MRVKILSRNPDDYFRETKHDIFRVPRNYKPTLHPFQSLREYRRALNAAKLEHVFAKPFIGSLDGHRDGISCMCKHPTSLSLLLSGAYDGEIRVWNLARRQCLKSFQAHAGIINGLCTHPHGEYFFSCSSDKVVKQWSVDLHGSVDEEPINTILGKSVFHGMDHHWKENIFATCGQQVDIWDEERSEPVRSFTWGVDTLHCVKFNPIETHLLGAVASDRSIILYDMRGAAPLRKVIMRLKSNSLSWNPMEAYIFTVANDDYNLYTFDMRNLKFPVKVHVDHVAAVMDVDYSPTGREFVSAGYDKTVGIFPVDGGHSRDIYFAKRMQRVLVVKWSLDNKYILSGSDEMNIRVWKARASEKLGMLRPREKVAFNYVEKLKDKFSEHPEVKQIIHQRHIPKMIYLKRKEHKTIIKTKRKREEHRRIHSKPGSVPCIPQKRRVIVAEAE